MKDRAHEEVMIETFRTSPVYALKLLQELLNEKNPTEIDILTRQLSAAFGENWREFLETYPLLPMDRS